MRAAFEREARDAGDAGQRLATEAERRDLFERVPLPDQILGQLRCRVPFQRQRHLFGRHAAAIIDHFDCADAAVFEADRDPSRARIDGVLNQFLQRSGRAFDHFSRCDAVYKGFGKASDCGHSTQSSRDGGKIRRPAGNYAQFLVKGIAFFARGR